MSEVQKKWQSQSAATQTMSGKTVFLSAQSVDSDKSREVSSDQQISNTGDRGSYEFSCRSIRQRERSLRAYGRDAARQLLAAGVSPERVLATKTRFVDARAPGIRGVLGFTRREMQSNSTLVATGWRLYGEGWFFANSGPKYEERHRQWILDHGGNLLLHNFTLLLGSAEKSIVRTVTPRDIKLLDFYPRRYGPARGRADRLERRLDDYSALAVDAWGQGLENLIRNLLDSAVPHTGPRE